MSAPSTCVVSGTVRNVGGSALAGAIIRANLVKPFIHEADGSVVAAYEVSTTSAGDGTWSLTTVETTLNEVTMTFTIEYPTGSTGNTLRETYTAMIPSSATANFSDLVDG